jgi:peptide/nickel transport system ATP-binding protein
VSAPILTLDSVTRWFRRRGLFAGSEAGVVRAVDGVNLELYPGRVLGLVGESGSGKSTLGELVTALQEPTAGHVVYDGRPVARMRGRELKQFRKDVQVVFQDPYATLNPRYRIDQTLGEPLVVHGVRDKAERRRRALQALTQAGLAPAEEFLHRWPGELSGGQRQRVAIARALVLEPKVLVADEPVSMLDVSVRGAILTLLRHLADELGLAVLFISHDLSTVRFLCDDVAIMYLGTIVESGPVETVMDHAVHPYTRALLHSVPEVGDDVPEDRIELPIGDPESVVGLSRTTCRYANRCAFAQPDCRDDEPPLMAITPGHLARCLHPRLLPVWPDDQQRAGDDHDEALPTNGARR